MGRGARQPALAGPGRRTRLTEHVHSWGALCRKPRAERKSIFSIISYLESLIFEESQPSSACCCMFCSVRGAVLKMRLYVCIFLQLAFSWPLPTLFVLLLWHGSLRHCWLGNVSFALLCVLKTVCVLGNEVLVFPWETTSRGVSLHMEVLGYGFWSISTILVSRFYFQVIIPKGSPLVTYWMFPYASLDFIFWLEWVVTRLVQFKFYTCEKPSYAEIDFPISWYSFTVSILMSFEQCPGDDDFLQY